MRGILGGACAPIAKVPSPGCGASTQVRKGNHEGIGGGGECSGRARGNVGSNGLGYRVAGGIVCRHGDGATLSSSRSGHTGGRTGAGPSSGKGPSVAGSAGDWRDAIGVLTSCAYA